VREESSSFWDSIVPWVDPKRCQRCADCAAEAACLAQGIRRERTASVPSVSDEVCFGCYSCAGACPHGAVKQPRKR
jgi:Fe-S-cluster-containing hydrogenase component 2